MYYVKPLKTVHLEIKNKLVTVMNTPICGTLCGKSGVLSSYNYVSAQTYCGTKLLYFWFRTALCTPDIPFLDPAQRLSAVQLLVLIADTAIRRRLKVLV